MIGDILAFLVGDAIYGALGGAEEKRLGGIARAEGKARGALRVVSGEAPGLSTTWRGCEARPFAGAITFEFNRIAVCRVSQRPQPLTSRESFLVPMGSFEVLVLDCAGAVVEWAVSPEDVDWVTTTIDPGTAEAVKAP